MSSHLKTVMDRIPRISGPIRRTVTRTGTVQSTQNYEHWSSSLKCPTQFFPSAWKFPNVCLLFIALFCSAILITYIYVYENLGPADSNQNAAFIVFFIANSSLILVSLFAFGFIQINHTGKDLDTNNRNSNSVESRRACFLINAGFFIILLVSLVAAMLFNLEPDARSTGIFLNIYVQKYGQPTKFFTYLQNQASCCGAHNYQDYKILDGSHQIPTSCCTHFSSSTENCTKDLNLIHKNGCYNTSPQLVEIEVGVNTSKEKVQKENENSRVPFYSIKNPELGLLLNILIHFPGATTVLATVALLLFNYYQCLNEGTLKLPKQWSRIRENAKNSEYDGKNRNQSKPKSRMRRVISKKCNFGKLRGKGNRTRLMTSRNNNNDRNSNDNNGNNNDNDSNSFNNSLLLSPRNNQSHIALDSFITGVQNGK